MEKRFRKPSGLEGGDGDGESNDILLWGDAELRFPNRPADPGLLPVEDERHWYDLEYAPWTVERYPAVCRARSDGGSYRMICLKPESNSYQRECEEAMMQVAFSTGVELDIRISGWDEEAQNDTFRRALRERPDALIHIPGHLAWAPLYRQCYDLGIPLIVTNLAPEPEAFRYVLSWVGHDAWLETRQLARKFADLMGYRGGYCILRHMPGCSAYYARTFGIITELSKMAPEMHCLDMQSPGMEIKRSEEMVVSWLSEFGRDLKGIVSADDIRILPGINNALSQSYRGDIVVVSNGTTRLGMEFLKEGSVKALNFKAPRLDGTLPIQFAVDWLNGLDIPRTKSLPVYVITRNDVDDFLNRKDFESVDYSRLNAAIVEGDPHGVDEFFDDVLLDLASAKVVSIEDFRGFLVESISFLMRTMNDLGIPHNEIIGDYASLYRSLFHHDSVETALSWLRDLTKVVIDAAIAHSRMSRIDRVITWVNANSESPLSLKSLGLRFGVTQRYLGQLFLKATGERFNDYLNRLRIEKATALLRHSTLSVREIARNVGYADPNYFYKVFRLSCGSTPSSFRQAELSREGSWRGRANHPL